MALIDAKVRTGSPGVIMPPLSDIVTAVIAGVSVVGLSIGTTLYITSDDSKTSSASASAVIEQHDQIRRYGIGDAYFPCRDRIQDDIQTPVRNVNVDSHSSRYDDLRNDNVVFIDLQLVDQGAKDAKDAKIVCRVSATNNEITAFQLRKG
jgi:hypothetical protein